VAQAQRAETGASMVMIDQVCWNEMNIGDELTLCCTDKECRAYEERLRRMLYQWQHFPWTWWWSRSYG